MKCHQRTMSPLSFVSSSFCSISTNATLSSSMPFPIDDKPLRQYKSTNHNQIDMDDPNTYMPKANGIHVDIIFDQAICSGWLTKHKKSTFTFIRSDKKRYVVLVDRMLYSFKSETPNTYREYFEITKDTHAYLSDRISGVPYCIEILKTKMGVGNEVWFLQVQDAETMKIWLSYIKKVIAWLRADNRGHITKNDLDDVVTEEYSKFSLKKRSRTNTSNSNSSSLNETSPYKQSYTSSASLSSIDTNCSDKARPQSRIESTVSSFALSHTSSVFGLPPQPPPPTSLPPPIPFT
ncbi:hypothetical protein CU098_005226 [Rhizopus stolonifer]|uniref:PH domain-containing protein n=1 Tax=Rhizopus stolonifer TaxID=4846 RepID=A0A367IX59_RHIST|nr:hypothetical protein CU098_005226 [Rhizopus stolonifer]